MNSSSRALKEAGWAQARSRVLAYSFSMLEAVPSGGCPCRAPFPGQGVGAVGGFPDADGGGGGYQGADQQVLLEQVLGAPENHVLGLAQALHQVFVHLVLQDGKEVAGQQFQQFLGGLDQGTQLARQGQAGLVQAGGQPGHRGNAAGVDQVQDPVALLGAGRCVLHGQQVALEGRQLLPQVAGRRQSQPFDDGGDAQGGRRGFRGNGGRFAHGVVGQGRRRRLKGARGSVKVRGL